MAIPAASCLEHPPDLRLGSYLRDPVMTTPHPRIWLAHASSGAETRLAASSTGITTNVSRYTLGADGSGQQHHRQIGPLHLINIKSCIRGTQSGRSLRILTIELNCGVDRRSRGCRRAILQSGVETAPPLSPSGRRFLAASVLQSPQVRILSPAPRTRAPPIPNRRFRCGTISQSHRQSKRSTSQSPSSRRPRDMALKATRGSPPSKPKGNLIRLTQNRIEHTGKNPACRFLRFPNLDSASFTDSIIPRYKLFIKPRKPRVSDVFHHVSCRRAGDRCARTMSI